MCESPSGAPRMVALPRTTRVQPAGAMKVAPFTVVRGVSAARVSLAAGGVGVSTTGPGCGPGAGAGGGGSGGGAAGGGADEQAIRAAARHAVRRMPGRYA